MKLAGKPIQGAPGWRIDGTEARKAMAVSSRRVWLTYDGVVCDTGEHGSPGVPLAVLAAIIKASGQYHVRKASQGAGSWVGEACSMWDARFGQGAAPAARIGKALKRLVEAHEWPVVREAWAAYVRKAQGEYATPERFAATFAEWRPVDWGAESIQVMQGFANAERDRED